MAARKKTATKKKITAKKSTAKKTTAKKATAPKATKTTAKKSTAKKTTAKKSTAKKSVAKKKTVAKKPAVKKAISVGKKPFTKSEFVTAIAESTDFSRKEISEILDVISNIIGAHLGKKGPSTFSWPGLLKMKVVKKPATKARKGVNPFTGEPTVFKAKPASRKVKILALKKLKEMADN